MKQSLSPSRFLIFLENVYEMIISGKKDIKLSMQYDLNYIDIMCAEI